MYKNIVIGILIIIAGYLIYKTIKLDPVDVNQFEQKIDSIQQINKKLNLQVDLFKEATSKLNLEQHQYEKIADSLQKLLSIKKLPCPKVVEIQSKEITALISGLKKCNQAKAIQVKTITKYEEIIINHELIDIEYNDMQKVSKKAIRKAKFKSFIYGTAVGAIIVGVLVIL